MISLIEPKFSITQNDTVLQVYHAKTGEGLPKHEHYYSHLVFCHAGRIIIRKEGRSLEMTAESQPVNLVENEWHEIEALEDGSIFVNTFDTRSTGQLASSNSQYNYFAGTESNPTEVSNRDQFELYLATMIQKILAETVSSAV